MSANHIASILTFIWTLIQAWYLTALGYGPSGQPIAWLICAVMAVVSAGLWMEKPWSRIAGAAVATAWIIFYGVALFWHGVSCANDPIQCYVRTMSQPILMAVVLVVLIRGPASNNRMERPREP